jgi:hypothetical protein
MSRWTARSTFAATLLAAVLPRTIIAQTTQVSGQAFEITPESAHATVGDSVTLRFRVRLDERDLLFDTIPAVVGELPPGVRVLSVEKLRRTPDRIFHGRATLAFYRPGHRPIPTFGLPFMRAVKGVQHATLASDSAYVDIVPVLPAGSPPLKDIRELETSPGLPLIPLVTFALVAFATAAYLRFRRRRRAGVEPTRPEEPAPVPQATPYDAALERLAHIERERWPMRNQVTRHYEATVEVLRDYLEAAEDIPAHERTTGELIWSLPPHLSDEGLREQLRNFLTESDLVKFARLRPTSSAAADFLDHARTILDVWHQAQTSSHLADAVR